MSDTTGNITKLTVNISERTEGALKLGAARAGVNKTDFVNRAIQILEWWTAEEELGNEHFVRLKGADELQRVKFL